MKKYIITGLLFTFILVLLSGCGKAADPPQKVFIDGAKKMLSTDMVNELTEKSNGGSLLGMPSDFLYNLNNMSNETAVKVNATDISSNDSASQGHLNLDLNTAHDAGTGDSSLEVSIGLGTETNWKTGLYINGNTALIKRASADKKIILYQMPKSNGKTFLDRGSAFLTGILSDNGKATTYTDSLKDRKELAARYLDPWLNDTKPEEYTDTQETRKLGGKDVKCRVITLTMTGERAYDFVLKNMKALQADPQFKKTDDLLGGLMYYSSTEIKVITQNADKGIAIPPASKKLIDELEGMSTDQIAAAKFKISIIFDGDNPIGLESDATTTDKDSKLDLMMYRNGMENQYNVSYHSTDGASVTLNMTKTGTGSDKFDVAGNIKIINAKGIETANGGFKGAVTETGSKYDLNGTYDLDMNIYNMEGTSDHVAIKGDLTFELNYKNKAGYIGTGKISMAVVSPSDPVKLKCELSTEMKLKGSVTITPPMYTDSNVYKVTTKEKLFEEMDMDWHDVSTQSEFLQAIMLVIGLAAS
jgi:hypothetical protein